MRKVTCPYCSKPAELVSGRETYPHRPDLADTYQWRCKPCGASVGCHRKGAWFYESGRKIVSDGTVPLGRLANAELRQAKMRVHAVFDPIWKDAGMSRKEAYSWLAAKLQIPVSACHVGMFDVAMCERATEVCRAHLSRAA